MIGFVTLVLGLTVAALAYAKGGKMQHREKQAEPCVQLKVSPLKPCAEALLDGATTLAMKRNWTGALELLTHLVAIEDSAIARIARATAYFEVRMLFQAQADLAHALKLAPNYAPAWGKMAYAHLYLGEREKALEAANKSLSLAIENPEAWEMRGNVYLALGNTERGNADKAHARWLLSARPQGGFFTLRAAR